MVFFFGGGGQRGRKERVIGSSVRPSIGVIGPPPPPPPPHAMRKGGSTPDTIPSSCQDERIGVWGGLSDMLWDMGMVEERTEDDGSCWGGGGGSPELDT